MMRTGLSGRTDGAVTKRECCSPAEFAVSFEGSSDLKTFVDVPLHFPLETG